MITTFSDALYDHLVPVFGEGDAVNRTRFAQGALPVPIAHFLEQSLDNRIERETAGLAAIATGWVDPGQDELRIGREAYVRLLARHAHFPPEDWTRELRQATIVVSSHLVRPVSTIVHFVFSSDHDELPAADAARRLEYFVAYSYLKTALSAWIQRHGKERLTRGQLHDLLSHVDRAMTADWSPEEWSNALGPLDRLGRDAGYRGIPVPLVEAFFDAKDNHVMGARLRSWAASSGSGTVASDELARILEPPRDPAPTPSASLERSVQPPSAAAPHPAFPVDQTGVSQEVAAGDDPDGQPLWKQFAGRVAPPKPSIPNPGEGGVPLWKRFRTVLDEVAEPTGLAALEQDLLGDASERRAEFVRDLFDGSIEAYGRVLGALKQSRGWPEASRLLADEVFRKYKVDIYSPTAVAFTDAIEARFRPGR